MSIWLKKKLSKLEIPPYDEEKYRKTVVNVKKIPLHSDIRMSNAEFFLDQIRFIRKQTWILKIVWVVFMMYLVMSHIEGMSMEMLSLFATASPILFLMNVKEIYGIYMPGLVELHLSARNCMEKVLLTRLLLFGVMDLLCLAGTTIFVSSLDKMSIWQMIIYSCVPYNLTCLGCMHIFNRREEDVLLYCVSYSVFLSCIFIILKKCVGIAYAETGIVLWLAAGIFITIGLFMELNKLIGKGKENLDGINIGRAV